MDTTATADAEAVRSAAKEVASPACGPHARWWLAVGVGLLVSIPLAWLLSYGALLPFYLGLFFFLLFGLVIGASMFRVASPHEPYRAVPVVVGTTIMVLLCWTTSLVLESRRFPDQMADEAINQLGHHRARLMGKSPREFREHVAGGVRAFLAERYPPGGTLGYVRWAAQSSVLRADDVDGLRKNIKSSQSRPGWIIRVVLSIALLGFGIGSQTFPLAPGLRRRRRTEEESPDEQ